MSIPQDSLDARISAFTGVNTSAAPANKSNGSSAPPLPVKPSPKTPTADASGPAQLPTLWDAFKSGVTGDVNPAVRYLSQFAREAPGAVYNGVTNAGNEMANTGEKIVGAGFDAADWVANKTGVGKNFFDWYTDEHLKSIGVGNDKVGPLVPSELQADAPKTGLGDTLQTMTQLGVGLAATGKFMKPLEGLALASDAIQSSKIATAGVKVAMGAAKGAVGDMASMDAYKSRLSDMMQNLPIIGDPIKQYLAADPNDSFAEAKLKQGLEGVLVGVPLEALMGTVSAIKASRLLTSKEAPEAVNAAIQTMNQKIISAKDSMWSVGEMDANGNFPVTRKAPKVANTTTLTEESVSDNGNGNMWRNHSITRPEGFIGSVATNDVGDKAVQISTSSIQDAYKGKGFGKDAYMQLADKVLGQGKELWSDGSVSEDAARVYDSLKKQGYTVEKDASATLNNEGKWVTPDKTTPVFKVTGAPTIESHPIAFPSQAQAEEEAAILNMKEVEARRANPIGKPWTQEQLDAYRTTVGGLDSPEKFQQLLQDGGTDFNFHMIHGEEDAKAQLEILAKIQREGLDKARGGAVVSHAETIALAKRFFPEENPEAFVGKLSQVYKNTQDLAAHLLAGRSLMVLQGRRIGELATLADTMEQSPSAKLRLAQGLQEWFDTVARVKSIQSNAARAVESGKIDVADVLSKDATTTVGGADTAMSALEKEAQAGGPISLAARKAAVLLHGMSYDDMAKLARQLRIANGDPNAIFGAMLANPRLKVPPQVLGGFQRKAAQGAEYLLNSLISGTHTMAVVNTSMGLNSLIRPLETINAGMMTSLHHLDWSAGAALRQEGWDTLAASYKGIWDSIHLAAKAMKIGQPILDNSGAFNPTNAIGGDLGTLVNIPSRLHMGVNEFWQQMAYRANATAAALKEAKEMGVQDVEKYVNDRLDASFAGNGRTGQGLDPKALNYAKEVTFSQDLPQNSVARGLQNMTNNNPLLKAVIPFVQRPANLMYWSWDRTPVANLFHKSFMDDLKAGGPRAASAMSRMGTGLGLWGAAWLLSASGRLTGRGPSNTLLNEQGSKLNQPPEYSINFGTTDNPIWLSYRQAEPMAAPMKLIADMVALAADTSQASGELDVHPQKNFALATATTMASAFTSETYLQSAVNFMSALGSNDPNAWKKFINNEAAAVVPNVLGQSNYDNSMREIRTAMDAALAKLPGFSQQVPPRFNLLGEGVMKPPGLMNRALNPWTMSRNSDGALEHALMKLGKAMPMPEPTKNGVDLTSDQFGKTKDGLTPYDRMMQLIGQPKNGVPNLREALTQQLLNNPGWMNMPDTATEKYNTAKNIIQQHRDIAYQQMLREFPGLPEAIFQGGLGKKAQKFLGDDGIRMIQSLTKQR